MPEGFYDIYRQMEQRRLRWIARVQGLDQARERIGALELAEPGDYLIYDFRQQTVVQQTVHLSARQPEPVPAESASNPPPSGQIRFDQTETRAVLSTRPL